MSSLATTVSGERMIRKAVFQLLWLDLVVASVGVSVATGFADSARGALYVPAANDAAARRSEIAVLEYDEQENAHNRMKSVRGRLLISAYPSPEYGRSAGSGRSQHKEADVVQAASFLENIHIPGIVSQHFTRPAACQPLAVVMPNPRSPPAAPSASSGATAS